MKRPVSLRPVTGFRSLHGAIWPSRRWLWRPRTIAFAKDVRCGSPHLQPQSVLEKPDSDSVANVRRFPFLQRTNILAGHRKPPTPTAHSCQIRSGLENSTHFATAQWLAVAFLATVVLVHCLKPSPFRYLVVPVAVPFAFLSPASAVATYILTVLVPCTFGENNIAVRLPVLLLAPMAYHALMHLKSSRPISQRALFVLHAALCLLITLVALAFESLSAINDNLHVYVGPIALLLAMLPLWTMSDRRFLFRVLALSGTMIAVRTLLRFSSYVASASSETVASDPDVLRGTLGKLDPNYLSCYIGFGLVCALYLLMEALGSKDKRWQVLVWLGPIAVSLVAMGKLASRGMTLALFAGLAVLVLATSIKLSRRFALLVLILTVGLGVAMSGGFDLLRARFLQEDVKTGAGRKDINLTALSLFADRQLDQQLLGGGGNSSLRAMGWHTHNAFTEQLMDHGIVGAFCFIGLFLFLGAASMRSSGPLRASALVLLCFTIVASMSVSPFRFAWGWIILACILPCQEQAGPAINRRSTHLAGAALPLRYQRPPLLRFRRAIVPSLPM